MATQKEMLIFKQITEEYRKAVKETAKDLKNENPSKERLERILFNCEQFEEKKGGSNANRVLIDAVKLIQLGKI